MREKRLFVSLMRAAAWQTVNRASSDKTLGALV